MHETIVQLKNERYMHNILAWLIKRIANVRFTMNGNIYEWERIARRWLNK